MDRERKRASAGFTLIELAIVLVIIGLLVGGVLAGQDMIKASQVRATISQVEKFNAAANTFYGKYSALPGDIQDPAASSFGFMARGPYAGEGDGNHLIEGNCGGAYDNGAYCQKTGESTVFWVDLATAKLIDSGLNTAVINNGWGGITTSQYVGLYLPKSRISDNLFFYVGGFQGTNYFYLSSVSQIDTAGFLTTAPGLTVQQAYNIDKKVDDGLPQSGNVTAAYLNTAIYQYYWVWASGGGVQGAQAGVATAPSSTTCYDNGGNSSNPMAYSVSYNNGNGVDCALSFKMQAGD